MIVVGVSLFSVLTSYIATQGSWPAVRLPVPVKRK